MSAPNPSRKHGSGGVQDGFTLVEVVISVVILSLITGALAAAFITSLNATTINNQRVHESNDAQIIAGFLVRDAQAAGGTNPATGVADPTLGVSTTVDPTCAAPGSLVARFNWIDYSSTGSSAHVANYSYLTAASGGFKAQQLVRTICVGGGAPASSALANKIVSPPIFTCLLNNSVVSPCPSLPDLVKMQVTESNNPVNAATPYTFTLSASVRPQAGTLPDNTTTVPMLLLGGSGKCNAASPPLDATGGSGASQINVYGQVLVNGGNSSCVAADLNGNYTSSGGTAVVQGTTCATPTVCTTYPKPIPDPYAGLPIPNGNCATGTHPAPSGGTYFPGVYQTDPGGGVSVLSPGIYIFCHGFSPNGVNVPNPGVLMYFAGSCAAQAQPCVTSGLDTLSAGGTNYFQPATTGAYKGLVMWQAVSDTVSPTFGTSNNSTTNLDGTVYVPGAILTVKKSTQLKAVVALGIRWGAGGGNGTTIIGTALPIVVTAGTLPNGKQNQAYPGATMTASGGGGTFTWQATGLPAGMSIDANTGVIGGTPTANTGGGTVTVTVTATDIFGTDSAPQTFSLKVISTPTVTSTGPSSRDQGATNQAITVNGTNFVNGGALATTFSGTGITVNSTVWNSATKLTVNISLTNGATIGARNVTVTSGDGGTGTGNSVFTVNGAPTVTSTSPNAQHVGVANVNITINGTNFVAGPSLASSFGAGVTVVSTTFVSANQLTAKITVPAASAPGARNVTVTNGDGTTAIGAGAFTVDAIPTITLVNPGTHVRNVPGVSVIISGTGFLPGATVAFTGAGNAPAVTNTTVNNGGQITVVINITNHAGTYDVMVTNTDGGTATLANSFKVT